MEEHQTLDLETHVLSLVRETILFFSLRALFLDNSVNFDSFQL